MMKHIGTAFILISGLLLAYAAAAAEVPEPFRGHDENSKYIITYDDLSTLLRTVVVDVATSDRSVAPPPKEITGTRMKVKVNKLTVNEGNRFLYETFPENDAAQAFLLDIQKNLERMPSHTPLEKFSRQEQLAYWLNLYTVTVINQVIAVYPKRNLKNMIDGRNSIFSQKLLTVQGIPLSLDDIQYTILKQNYDSDPLILYGLYQGNIGGPDIRPTAYNGDDVYNALEDNAFEFINSNRGTYIRDENTFRVSSFYERNSMYFPDFETDLSKHLLDYLEGEERDALVTATRLKPNIDDWTVTDFGGSVPRIGGSFAMNSAALLDSYRANHRNVQGGHLTAIVTTTWEQKPDDDIKDREDLDRIEDLESGDAPVDGAGVSDVAAEDPN